MFLINSTYKLLEALLFSKESWGRLKDKVFGVLWKSLTLTKVIGFSWKLLLNQILNRRNLLLRKAIFDIGWRKNLPIFFSIAILMYLVFGVQMAWFFVDYLS